MRKKILTLSVAVLLLPVFASCQTSNAKAASRMELSINPDIEVLLDENGVVVSVTGLNEDGQVVISGEKLVGKTAEEAGKIIVDISYKCGYLNENNKNVNISVTSDDVNTIYNNVKTNIEGYLTNNSIQATVNQKLSDFANNLDAKISEISYKYEQSDIASMTYEEKLTILNQYRVETKNLVTEELQESYAYKKASEYKEELLNAKKDLIAKMDLAAGQAYEALINQLETAIDTINDLYEDNFIDSESNYQKLVAKIYDYKLMNSKLANCKTINEMISEIDNSSLSTDPTIVAFKSGLSVVALLYGNIDYTINTSAKKAVDSAFSAFQSALDYVISSLNTIKSQVEVLINQAKGQLQTVLSNIQSYELQLPSTIITELENKANDFINKAEKEIKNEYAEFAKDHKEEIEKAKERYASLKAELMA